MTPKTIPTICPVERPEDGDAVWAGAAVELEVTVGRVAAVINDDLPGGKASRGS
jgi:hypothetical protein